jgi:hypothetical protein
MNARPLSFATRCTRALLCSFLATTLVVTPVHASTFAYVGTVTEVTKETAERGSKTVKQGAIARGTTVITQQDYTNNPQSWLDRPIEWSIHPSTTVTALNGRFTASGTVAQALHKGAWGSFYESIAHDVYLTPDYHLGNLVGHEADADAITVATWRSKGSYHFPEALPAEMRIAYDASTRFMVEDRLSTAEEVLERSGDVLQVHPPREQVVLLETAASAFDANALPVKGGRGDANAASTNAVLVGWTPTEYVFRDGSGTEFPVERLGSARLDGKGVVGDNLLLKPGRHVALVFYRSGKRSGKRPVQSFFSTRTDEIRGTVSAVDGTTLTIATVDWDGNPGTTTVVIDPDGTSYLDGVVNGGAAAVGQTIRVFPKRPQTIVALLRRSLITNGSSRRPKVIAEGYLPVAGIRAPRRVVSGVDVTLDGRSSYAIDGSIADYRWEFSDGTTAEGETVIRTFDGDHHGSHEVTLTVTCDRGHSHTTRHHLVAAPAAIPATGTSADGLQAGLKVAAWDLDEAGRKAISRGAMPGEHMVGDAGHHAVVAEMNGNDPALRALPRATAKRFTGFIHAPTDGWYAVGAYFRNRLWIDDHPVLDGNTGATGQGQRSWVHLEAGLHAIRFESAEESSKARFTWMYLDGGRVVAAEAAGTATEDLMYRTYRPMADLLFHE